jgi:hypothetical protein
MKPDVQTIARLLRIDLADPLVRQRAWQRQHVFHAIARECEAEGNVAMAHCLRRIIQQATAAEPDLLSLALLAGANAEDHS